MTKGNNILLAALGGAAVGALVANYLTTEKGKQMRKLYQFKKSAACIKGA